MKTLVIYDLTGQIFLQASGDIKKPEGIPHLEIEVPQGKLLKSIDTTVEPHEPVYRNITDIDTDTCTLEDLKAYQTVKSKENLETYLSKNPITSTCHGGVEKLYTITKDKQALLTQMILISQVAIQSGIPYQPSWNAQGEPCTYDWTIPELQQLAFEIEAVVRPLISHQQTMEADINLATTKEAILVVSIEF